MACSSSVSQLAAQPLKWLDLNCFVGPLLALRQIQPPPSHPSRIEPPHVMGIDVLPPRSRDRLSFCIPEFSRLLGSSGMATHQAHHRSIEQRPAVLGVPLTDYCPPVTLVPWLWLHLEGGAAVLRALFDCRLYVG